MIDRRQFPPTLPFPRRERLRPRPQMLRAGTSRREVLTQLATVGEVVAGAGSAVSILVLDDFGLLRNGASPNLPSDYLDAIDRLRPDAGVGTCAAAAATGEVVVTPDFRADAKWASCATCLLRSASSARGAYRSSPADGRVLGTFGTFPGARAPRRRARSGARARRRRCARDRGDRLPRGATGLAASSASRITATSPPWTPGAHAIFSRSSSVESTPATVVTRPPAARTSAMPVACDTTSALIDTKPSSRPAAPARARGHPDTTMRTPRATPPRRATIAAVRRTSVGREMRREAHRDHRVGERARRTRLHRPVVHGRQAAAHVARDQRNGRCMRDARPAPRRRPRTPPSPRTTAARSRSSPCRRAGR